MAIPVTSGATRVATTLFLSECVTFAGPAFTFRTKITLTGPVVRIYNNTVVVFEISASGVLTIPGLSVIGTAGIVTSQAATQDAIALLGRAGGASSYKLTLTTAVLTANCIATFPDATGTVALLSLAQSFTAHQTFTSISATSARIIPNSGVPTYAEGNLFWDDNDHTLAIQTEIDGVTLQVGHEMYIRASNKTGSLIADGSVVYVDGATGNRPKIVKAIATSPFADKVVGVCTSDIANDAIGYITTSGVVHGLDTSAWVEGTELYVSAVTDGAYTSTRPVAPNHAVSVGIVIRQHANQGELLVHPNTGTAISALHDVLIATPLNNNALRYVTANTRWENTDKAGWLDIAATWTTLQTFSAGLTVSAGTTALQAVTCTSLTASGLTPGRVALVTTGGLLIDSSAITATAAGSITIGDGTTSSPGCSLNGAVSYRPYRWKTNGVLRWDLTVNNMAESGANAGSNFQIVAFADDGVAYDTPIAILRAAGGTITLSRPVTCSLATGAGLTVSSTTDATTTSDGGVRLSCGLSVAAGKAIVGGSHITGPKCKMTAEGGFAVLMTADETIAVGSVCSSFQGGTAGRVKKTPITGNENDMPIGVAYTAAAAAGSTFWMVVSGIVGVLPDTATTAAQGYVITTSAVTAGLVTQSATAPAAAVHFEEVGHFIATGSGAGAITNAVVHFN